MSQVIQFYGPADEYGCFSNFAEYPIRVDGETWPTSEHYFQAQKFADAAEREAVRRAPTPARAKRMGNDRGRRLRADWESIKVAVMREAVGAKFRQHPELREKLLGTTDAKLVEHTDRDAYWGDGGDGSGKNMLGRVLMEIREELRQTPRTPLRVDSA